MEHSYHQLTDHMRAISAIPPAMAVSAGQPGDRDKARAKKKRNKLTADAVGALQRIKHRHQEQAEAARDKLNRLGRRDQLQARVTARAAAAATDNDVAVLTELIREHTAHCAVFPETVDQWVVLGCRDVDGRTPLHYAACHGCYEAAIYLLTAGADGTMVDTAGFTAMHFAAAYGHIRIIVLLNQFDKELVGQRDRRGQTALHVGCQAETRDADVVSLLLRIGADVEAVDDESNTARNLTPYDAQKIQGVLKQHEEDKVWEEGGCVPRARCWSLTPYLTAFVPLPAPPFLGLYRR